MEFENQHFAEIEIESNVESSFKNEIIYGKQINLSETINPQVDETRKIFSAMRDISRNNFSSYFANSKLYSKQSQMENSKIFYRQAVFMKDFEDDYSESVPFSAYFPYYQQMGYEQLRTYFTWRTKVRKGNIENTSISYAFLYIYELLNNIGLSNAEEGLNKLMEFWKAFKVYDATIDKYLLRWIKDYHIYYELPKSFKDFLIDNELQKHYPSVIAFEPDKQENFEWLKGISKYNIEQSTFYNEETKSLIAECFDFVLIKLKAIFAQTGLVFNELIFYPSKSKSVWSPFNGALFYTLSSNNKPDRKIVLSENEIYLYSKNKWLFSTAITTDTGKQLIGYILKQMEVKLREVTKYKYKLTANSSSVSIEIIQKLNSAGFSLEKEITDSVMEFYAEKNKINVTINENSLNKIRLESLDTQEKLIVEENELQINTIFSQTELLDENLQKKTLDNPAYLSDSWTTFKNILTETELNILQNILNGGDKIKQIANESNIMLEVLADSINEKAVDHIGDNILEFDEIILIYDEYKENIMKMVTL